MCTFVCQGCVRSMMGVDWLASQVSSVCHYVFCYLGMVIIRWVQRASAGCQPHAPGFGIFSACIRRARAFQDATAFETFACLYLTIFRGAGFPEEPHSTALIPECTTMQALINAPCTVCVQSSDMFLFLNPWALPHLFSIDPPSILSMPSRYFRIMLNR